MLFDLKPEYFHHQSRLHGIMHTYRVMYNVLLLSREHHMPEHVTKTAFCGAFIHDMARRHDGYCAAHGEWAVKEKMPLFEDGFRAYGLHEHDIDALKTAVTYHSLPTELLPSNPHYQVTALLKDADALDRIRLGVGDLNPRYLRLPRSKSLISAAEHNFYLTEHLTMHSWDAFLLVVKRK